MSNDEKVYKIGFTGTRFGMKAAQLDAYRRRFIALDGAHSLEFHHGDCIGADAEAHDIAIGRGTTIVIHPPIKTKHRAWKEQAGVLLPPQSHFARNRAIVDACDLLIATPKDPVWQPRGGTWYTIDYACKQKKPLWVIWPDGTETLWNAKEPGVAT